LELTRKATKKPRAEEKVEAAIQSDESEPETAAAPKVNGKAAEVPKERIESEQPQEPKKAETKAVPPPKGKGKPPTKGTKVFAIDDSSTEEEEEEVISKSLKADKGKAMQKVAPTSVPVKSKETKPATQTITPATQKSVETPTQLEDPKKSALAVLVSSLPTFDFGLATTTANGVSFGEEQQKALAVEKNELPVFNLLA